MEAVEGKVIIAPGVLTAIVRQTALEQRGVSRLASAPPRLRGLLAGTASDEGIFVAVTDKGAHVELHVVAEPDANMLALGNLLQTEVIRAIEEMVGMPVALVDIYIDDVEVRPNRPS